MLADVARNCRLTHMMLVAVNGAEVFWGRSGFAEIAVDDAYAFDRPAGGDSTIAQSVLALGAFAVLGDLTQSRLAHIEIGIASEVIDRDLEISHERTPLRGKRRLSP